MRPNGMRLSKVSGMFLSTLFALFLAAFLLVAPAFLVPDAMAGAVGRAIHAIASPYAHGTPSREWERGARLVLGYVRGGADVSTLAGIGTMGTLPFLNKFEMEHLRDVRAIYREFAELGQFLVIGAGLSLVILAVGRNRRSLAISFRLAGISSAAASIGIAALSALDFDAAFSRFHRLAFPDGNWRFWETDALTLLFPQSFWFGALCGYLASVALLGSAAFSLGAALARPIARKDD